MAPQQELSTYKVFIVSITLSILLVLSGIFLGMALHTRQLIFEENLAQARALFSSIVLARTWNTAHGGVYVEKKAGVISNPYMPNPDITALDQRVFTIKNHALMTREISEYAQEQGAFSFHITSLLPLNPENAPDPFEKQALDMFDSGMQEMYRVDSRGDQRYFRYIARLMVEEACLPCHAAQGYKLGDVRGGISVTFPIEKAMQKMRSNNLLIALLGLIAALLLLGLIYFFTFRLIQQLSRARRQIEQMAITDELTGLHNRRYAIARFRDEFERARRMGHALSCILFDIDHFKAINDTHGHITGDKVLREVAERVMRAIRPYDILGRYGGEEFLVVSPEITLDHAVLLAERLKDRVKAHHIPGLSVTISSGVTAMNAADTSIDDLIRRADAGLYQAKASGRDRVAKVE